MISTPFLMAGANGSLGYAYEQVEFEPFDVLTNFTVVGGTNPPTIVTDPADGTNNLLDINGTSSSTPNGTWDTSAISGTDKYKVEIRVDMAPGSGYWDYIYIGVNAFNVILSAGSANNHPELYGDDNIVYGGKLHPFVDGWQIVTLESIPNPSGTSATRKVFLDGELIIQIEDVAINDNPVYIYFNGRSVNNLVYVDYVKTYKWNEVNLNSGLEAHFLLNNNGNNVAGTVDAELFNSVTFTGEMQDNSASIAYVKTPSVAVDTSENDFTVSGWFKKTSSTSGHIIKQSHSVRSFSWYIAFEDISSTLRYSIGRDAASWTVRDVTGVLKTDTSLTHFVLTVEGLTSKMYINGVLIVSFTETSRAIGTDGSTWIGQNPSSQNNPDDSFDGFLSNMRIYNHRVADQEMVDALFAEGYYPKQLTEPTKDELIAYYPLTGTGEDAYGEGGNETGTEYNGVAFVDDNVRGSVASFDGLNDYISRGRIALDQTYTISLWFKKDSNKDQWLVNQRSATSGNAREWDLNYYIDGGLKFQANGATPALVSSSNLLYTGNLGEWHHVVITLSDTTLSMYIDGTIDDTADVTGLTFYTTSSEFNIGKAGASTFYFDGSMSDLRIYDRALTAVEVGALYTETNEPTFGLVAHYPLTADSRALDLWSSNDGTEATTVYIDEATFGTVLDGSIGSSHITTPHFFNTTSTPYTFSMWIKPTSIGVTNLVFGTDDNNSNRSFFGFGSSNTTIVVGWGTGFDTVDITTIVLNQWYHLLVVIDASTNNSHAYIDGVYQGEGIHTGVGLQTTYPSLIGAYNNNGSVANCYADVRNVRIYGKELTTIEIEDIYNYEKNFRHIDIDDGLIGYYPLFENSLDNNYTQADGTDVGGLTYDGTCAVFDGVDDEITLPATTLTASFSISFWCTFEDYVGGNYIFGCGSVAGTNTGMHIGYNSSIGHFQFSFYGANQVFSLPVEYHSDLYHWVCTYDSTTNSMKLYQNNVLVDSYTTDSDFLGDTTAVIGDTAWATSYNHQGKVKDFRIYNRAIADYEVDIIFREEGGTPELGVLPEPSGLDDQKAGLMYWVDVGLTNVTANGTIPTPDDFSADSRRLVSGVQATAALTYGSTTFASNTNVWGAGVGSILSSYHSKMCWGGDESQFTIWLFTSDDGTTTHASVKHLVQIVFTAVDGYYNNTFTVTEYHPTTQVPTVLRNEVDWHTGTYAGTCQGNFVLNDFSIGYTNGRADATGIPTHSTTLTHGLPDRFHMVIYGRAYGTYTQSCTALARMYLNNKNLV